MRRMRVSVSLLGALAGAVLLLAWGGSPARAAGAGCDKTWAAAVDGNWTDGSKWSPAGVPGSGDHVCITAPGSYTVSETGTTTVDQLDVGDGTSPAPTLWVAGSFAGSFTTLTVANTLAAPVALHNQGTLLLESTGGAFSSDLSVSGEFRNDGVFRMGSGSSGERKVLDGDVVNTASGTIEIGYNPAGFASPATLTNAGSISVEPGAYLNLASVPFTQTAGTTAVEGGFRVQDAALDVSGGDFTGANNLQGLRTQTTISGSPTGTVELGGNSGTRSLDGTIPAGFTAWIRGSSTLGYADLASAGLTNNGTLRLESTGGGYSSTLTFTAGALTNHGTLELNQGSAGNRFVDGPVTNDGTVTVTHNSAYFSDGLFTNSGNLAIPSGKLTVTTGDNLPAAAAAYVTAGTVTVDTTLRFEDVPLAISGGAFTGPGHVEGLRTQTTISGSPTGTVELGGNSGTRSLDGTIPAGFTAWIRGSSTLGYADLASAGLTNNGTLRLESTGGGYSSTLTFTAGALTNHGTLELNQGSAGNRFVDGPVTNDGTVTVTHNSAYFSDGLFTNSGNLAIPSGKLTVTTGDNLPAAAAAYVTAGTVTVDTTLRFEDVPLAISGGAFTGPGHVEGLRTQTTISGSPTGTVELGGNSGTRSLDGTIPAGFTAWIRGSSTLGYADLASAGLTNNGTLRLESTGGGYSSTLTFTAGALTNHGTLELNQGSAGNRFVDGPVTNDGTVTVTHNSAYFSDGLFTNSGNLDVVAAAALQVSGAGTSGYSQTAGATNADGTFVVQGAPFTATGGSFSGSGRIAANGGALTVSGDPVGTIQVGGSGATLEGTIPSGLTVLLQGSDFFGHSNVTSTGLTNNGTLRLQSTGGGYSSTLTLGAGTLTNHGTIELNQGSAGNRYISGDVANAGSGVVDVEYNGADIRNGVVTNAGIIRVRSGRLFSITNAASLANFSGTTLTGGTYDLAGILRFTGAQVVTDAATIVLDGPLSAIQNQAGTNALGGLATVTAAGSFTVKGGRAFGAGPLANAGVVAVESSSAITSSGVYAQSAGTTTVVGTLTATGVTLTGGVLRGTGTVAAPVTNTGGSVEPGLSPGQLAVGGGYDQDGGTLRAEITGAVPAVGYDRLAVTGTATLGGTLVADFAGLPGPVGGTTYRILTAASVSGSTALSALNVPAGYVADHLQGADYVDVRLMSQSETTVTSSVNPSVFGEDVALTAAVTSVPPGQPTPTGSVTFTVDGVPGIPVALDGTGHASMNTSSLAVGTHTVSAAYDGDAVFVASNGSLTGDQLVNKAGTSTALALLGSPSTFGSDATFRATVSVTAPGAGTPGGTVTFTVDGVPGAPVALSGNEAETTTNSLSPGDHSVSAAYDGDGNFETSASNTQTQNVHAATTTTVTSSANPSTYGANVTFTATVTAPPGAGTPAGTVVFTVDGTPGAPVALDGAGQTTTASAALAVGAHSVSASFAGVSGYDPSAGALPGGQTVDQAASATALESSLNPSGVGQDVTFTATVTGAGDTPTGDVVFKEGANTLAGPVALDGAGQASFATSALPAGPHTVDAFYYGDTNHQASNGGVVQQVNSVVQPSTTALASSLNPSTYGQDVTLTATVTGGGGTPTGTVVFTVDGTPGAPVALDGAGQASFATAALDAGTHSVSAAYGGDGTYTSSNDTLPGGQTVDQAASATALESSLNPSTVGDGVTFTATVTPVAPASGTPTGTVTFSVDGVPVGPPVALDGTGHATYATAALGTGPHTVDADYAPADANHSGSSAPQLTQTVQPAPSATVLASDLNPSVFGQNVTFTATVTGAPGTPTGAVVFVVDGVSGSPVPLTGAGQATMSTASLAVGPHSVVAQYGGDADHDPSASSTLTQTVNPAGGDTVSFTASGAFTYANSGAVTSGGVTNVYSPDGKPAAVKGFGTIPGVGVGSMTFAVDVRRLFLTDLYYGSIWIRDANGTEIGTTIFFQPATRSGATVSGTANWLRWSPWPILPYTLSWSVTDN